MEVVRSEEQEKSGVAATMSAQPNGTPPLPPPQQQEMESEGQTEGDDCNKDDKKSLRRQQQQQQQHPSSKKRKKRKFGKRERNDGDGDDDDNDNNDYHNKNNTEAHPGSFAHPQQQAMFPDVPGSTESSSINADSNATSNTNITNTTTTKKKIAVLVGYLGTQYAGFQINARQRTVQAEFERAAHRAGMIASANFGFPHKYSWSTSGRTDKGVHAAAQVVSFKAELPLASEPSSWRQALNEHLPPSSDICVLDVVRTTKSFCAKKQRDRVRYQYMIPSFCLYPAEEWRALLERLGLNPVITAADAVGRGLDAIAL